MLYPLIEYGATANTFIALSRFANSVLLLNPHSLFLKLALTLDVLTAGGYFMWIELPAQVDVLKLHKMALDQGISLAPGPIFSAKREFANCIRLNYGYPDSARQQEAIATLGRLIAAQL